MSYLSQMLRPTETLCWLNEQLCVLFDPTRERRVVVLGVEGHDEESADLAIMQVSCHS